MGEEIVLARDFYAEAAVAEAVAAFADLATFEVAVGEAAIRVTMRDADPDVAGVLADELCNLALMRTVEAAAGEAA